MTNARAGGIIAFAPGSIGNLGPGLDVLGCALTGPGDEVHAWWTDTPGVTLADAGHPDLPTDPTRHSCTIAASAILSQSGFTDRGVAVALTKGLPLSGGQGGSGASAVAAAMAVDQLIVLAGGASVGTRGLLAASLSAESIVAGRHLDNLAASLLGGVICARSVDPIDVDRIPLHAELWFALAMPALHVRTADARSVLPSSVSRETLIAQLASVAALVSALGSGDLALVGRAMVDHVAEPARAAMVPGFVAAKGAALGAGALGASLSGSGPTTFAACATEATAAEAAMAMRRAYEMTGIGCSTRIAQIDREGTRWRSA